MPMNIFRFSKGKPSVDEDGDIGVRCTSFVSDMVPQHPIFEVTDETVPPQKQHHKTPNRFPYFRPSWRFTYPISSDFPYSPPDFPGPPSEMGDELSARLSEIYINQDEEPETGESRLQLFNRRNDEVLAVLRERFLYKWTDPSQSTSCLENFKVIKSVGIGSFGRVMLVKDKRTKMYYAMKVLKKEKVVLSRQVQHTLDEKRILDAIEFPFIVNLKHHFKDNTNLYIVMDYVPGDLFFHLRKLKRFKESLAQFYAAQIVLTLEYLQSLDIIYRDLKPENILLGMDGYLKITDFGLAKHTKNRSWTVLGTPDYMAPEISLHQGYNKGIDWWALGILIFEMTAGYPPFHFDGKDLKMLHVVVSKKVKFPSHFSVELKDLLEKLLQVDITKRLGNMYRGAKDVREHEWFSSIDWLNIVTKKVKPPLMPKISSPKDTTFFDQVPEDKKLFKKSPVPLFEKEFRSF